MTAALAGSPLPGRPARIGQSVFVGGFMGQIDPVSGGNMRIVVADDSLLARQVLTNAVESLGHECRAVADGLAAYRQFREHGGDVFISDWSMPGLDGLELCRRIRSIPGDGHTYFILVTAHGGNENLLDAMRAGVDDYLTKPLDQVALEACLIAAERVTALHRERQAHTARLETLLRASRQFAFQVHPDTLLPEVLKEAIELLGADEGEIVRWDEQQHTPCRIHRIAATTQQPGPPEVESDPQPAGVTAVVAIDEAQDERGGWAITASMLHRRKLLGTIRLTSSGPGRRFEQTDADALELLASVAAASLIGTERSRLEGVLLAGRTMSHELNNMLALMVGNVDLLAEDPRLPADLRQEAQSAIETTQDAARLLARLSRLTEIREVDWGPYIGATIDLQHSTAPAERQERRLGQDGS